ncbi:MAG: hypothetical protein JSV78_08505 [Phycisphaerales bacterium]|nr:MAG: hypothetical protein JSV78_08505 [Phycisphaerales bacterium]
MGGPLPDRLLVLGLCLLAMLMDGCTSGSLATNTGPRPPLHQWSTANRQMVYVGEQVEFDFVLTDGFGNFVHPDGVADYIAAFIGGERIQADYDLSGHFPFSYRFDTVKPGDEVSVKAVAYKQNHSRDFMLVAGTWMQSESPYEVPDTKVASDDVALEAYEASIELTVPQPKRDLDPSTGVIRIRRNDGMTTSVFVSTALRPGFSITGPQPGEVYRIRYVPKGDEVNPTGQTDVELTIYDMAGQPHQVTAKIDTP